MGEVKKVFEILEAAREHAARLSEDIALARTRDEHVRVTARANEAAHIAVAFEKIFTTPEETASE